MCYKKSYTFVFNGGEYEIFIQYNISNQQINMILKKKKKSDAVDCFFVIINLHSFGSVLKILSFDANCWKLKEKFV